MNLIELQQQIKSMTNEKFTLKHIITEDIDEYSIHFHSGRHCSYRGKWEGVVEFAEQRINQLNETQELSIAT